MTEFWGGSLHAALVHAATAYDRKQENKRSYSIYALGHYMRAIEDFEAYVAEGASVRQALLRKFNGPLLNHMLKAANEAPATEDDRAEQGRAVGRMLDRSA